MIKKTITIKRPTGEIETIDVSDKFTVLNEQIFQQVKKHTAEAGRGEAISWEEEHIDTRTDAEKAFDDVSRAMGAVDAAENASYYSAERIIKARMAADKARADWAKEYPEAAAAMKAEAEAEEARRQRRIRNSEGFRAKHEWRD